MVRIRLRRVGATNQPSYRIVVADKRSPRNGRFIDTIGFYNPRTEPATMEIDEAKALDWLSKGAQPSESVMVILKNVGTWNRYERLKQGEALEALVAEAEKALATKPAADKRTRRDDLIPKPGSKKKAAPEEVKPAPAVKAEAEAVEPADTEAPEAEAAE